MGLLVSGFQVLFYSNLKFSEKWWAEISFSNCYGQLSKLINNLQQVLGS